MNKLWTKDFTIITAGSIVSLLGNALIGFALSLFVLDYMESTFYYAVYLFMYTLPQIAAPIISGPLIDRFSRRKTIYSLDFLSTAIYLILALTVYLGAFNFIVFAIGVFLAGTINSVYQVAFESFYPMLITEGNYSKAYSIASTLENFAFLILPVSTLVYKSFGIVPVLVFSALAFFIAAIFETRISNVEAKEDYLVFNKSYAMRVYIDDMKEGWSYLKSEKGLLAVAAYFTFSSMASSASQIISLPYFKNNFHDGEFVFMSVAVFLILGRTIGGGFHYKMRIPAENKFYIALFVYVAISLLEGSYLYMPLMVMRVMALATGMLGVTSYNIRISATQSYVPHEKKGRFNGIFIMLMTLGALVGQLISGALTELIDMRLLLLLINLATGIAAIAIIGGNKKYVSAIYNRQA